MAVLNITPDSFSDGGRLLADGQVLLPQIVDIAGAMIDAGADILDIGGESTRPGAEAVSAEQEAARVLPVIEALAALDVLISLDTSKPEVALRGIELGCHMINDAVSMQSNPQYADVVTEIRDFFQRQVHTCREAGIDAQRLMLDPGFGFGKTLEHNLALLRNLQALRVDGLPILVGLSRKSMLGAITGRDVSDRQVASAVGAALAIERGANILRVHDVEATRDAVRIVQAVNV
jgi:dihydropteroate synthase